MKLRRPDDALSCLQNRLLLCKVRTLYDCNADQEDELTFHAGEIIVMSEKEESNWWVSEPAYGDWHWDVHDRSPSISCLCPMTATPIVISCSASVSPSSIFSLAIKGSCYGASSSPPLTPLCYAHQSFSFLSPHREGGLKDSLAWLFSTDCVFPVAKAHFTAFLCPL